jgi:aspartyl-tRNA(Asn)/glutamyl-tRNA(Gln) amidotransferase subunit C
MGIHVDEKLTRKVAGLARLELTDDEVRLFTAQLAQVLGYVEQLEDLEVSEATEPLTHPLDLAAPLREDTVRPSPDVLEGAPEVVESSFKVPPIL